MKDVERHNLPYIHSFYEFGGKTELKSRWM
jgi:hypothetical protein